MRERYFDDGTVEKNDDTIAENYLIYASPIDSEVCEVKSGRRTIFRTRKNRNFLDRQSMSVDDESTAVTKLIQISSTETAIEMLFSPIAKKRKKLKRFDEPVGKVRHTVNQLFTLAGKKSSSDVSKVLATELESALSSR
tara:strand:+ start:735 stop:1151 length:417 start_codon:yes stop_codon:yes gene_type:complete